MAPPVKHPRQVKSFTRRGGRIPARLQRTVDEHAGRFLITPKRGESIVSITDPVDLSDHFDTDAPLTVEIGSGGGDQIVHAAATHPDRTYLAMDVWWPGIAQMIARAVKADVTNLRVMYVDAVDALPLLFGPNPKPVEVWTFFPDPWPKARHHKRRLVTPDFASLVSTVLKPGGTWRLATDWADYAWQMRDAVNVDGLTNIHAGERPDPNDPEEAGLSGGFAPRWEGRITTRFENRGIREGRSIYDLTVISDG